MACMAQAYLTPEGQLVYFAPPQGGSAMTMQPPRPAVGVMHHAAIPQQIPVSQPAAAPLQPLQPDPTGGPVPEQQQQPGLVADLCKIIERQSQEIALLVQNRTGAPGTPPHPTGSEGGTFPDGGAPASMQQMAAEAAKPNAAAVEYGTEADAVCLRHPPTCLAPSPPGAPAPPPPCPPCFTAFF